MCVPGAWGILGFVTIAAGQSSRKYVPSPPPDFGGVINLNDTAEG